MCLLRWKGFTTVSRRMKDMRIGPFSVETTIASDKKSSSLDWRVLLDNDDSNYPAMGPKDERTAAARPEDENKENAAVWREFVKVDVQQQRMQKCFHGSIAMAALYPDCDMLSNAAVRWEVPVPKLQCRSGTTELVYGV